MPPLIRWTYTRDIPNEFYRNHGKKFLNALSQEMYVFSSDKLLDTSLVFEYGVESSQQVHHGYFLLPTKRTDSALTELCGCTHSYKNKQEFAAKAQKVLSHWIFEKNKLLEVS